MTLLRWLSRYNLLLLLIAVALALGLRALLTADPTAGVRAHWQRIPARVPYQVPGLEGPLEARPDRLNLDHYEGVRFRLPQRTEGPIDLGFAARMPPDGLLQAALEGPGPEPRTPLRLTLTLDLTRAGRTGLTRVIDQVHQPFASCETGPARPVADRWQTVILRLSGGRLEAFLDGVLLARCQEVARVDAVRLETGVRRIWIDNLAISLGGQRLLADPFTHPFTPPPVFAALLLGSLLLMAALRRLEESRLLRTGMSPDSARLAVTLTGMPLLLMPLLMDVDLAPVLEALRLGLTRPKTLIFSIALGLTLVTKLVLHLSRPGVGRPGADEPGRVPGQGIRSGGALIGLVLAQTGLLLLLADGAGRIVLALLAGLALPVGWLVFSGRRSTIDAALLQRIERLLALVLGVLLLVKVGWQMQGPAWTPRLWIDQGGAWMPFALGAAALSIFVRLVVLNLNAKEVRGANAGSLLLAIALLVTGEAAARATYLERSLKQDDTALQEFVYLKTVRKHRDWPDQLFPVAFEPRKAGTRLRVVCMGGSSTAGAYQMKDLNLFYPRRLELAINGGEPGAQAGGEPGAQAGGEPGAQAGGEPGAQAGGQASGNALAPAEVLNQGVGGWTTLHIRRYLEAFLPALDADLVTLYVGHNDLLTRSSVPYRERWRQLEAGESATPGLHGVLNRIRLYVLFKQALLLGRDGFGQSAVPLEDARENLEAIISAVKGRGGQVLLMSEALNPDPLPLEPYFAMMREVAADNGALYLDMARALWTWPEQGLFLDDCHLSERGHQVMAERMLEFLRQHPELTPRK